MKTNDKPEWYWKRGLHDAVIISVAELNLPVDWKTENPLHNCFEINLDSSKALYENVKKISLYNYNIVTPRIDINSLQNPWWVSDTISQNVNSGMYTLEINIEDKDGDVANFIIAFEKAEVER